MLWVASTYLASRHLGAWAAALLSGLWALEVGLSWSRRVGELERSIEHHAELALRDDLTGLGNDRSFRATLSMGLGSPEVPRPPLGLVLVDLDQFKTYNDSFGHPAGDEILKAIGSILMQGAGPEVLAYRLGGDEFAAILPDGDGPSALRFAERSRQAIEGHAWPLRPITASFGVATASRTGPDTDPASLLDRADRALYRAKRDGRNRVAGHPEVGTDHA
jgi:diguanylate cyclase (GGDEF)-like protein